MAFSITGSATVRIDWLLAVIVLGGQGIVSPRTPDAVSPRQCPTKKYRLAITTLRTPDARSAQSNIVIVRFQSYVPTLRCRCVATPRLVANKDYVTMPLAPPSKRLRCLCEMFSLGHSLGSCASTLRCRCRTIPCSSST